MTAYERIARAMNHQEPDRVPVSCFVENPTLYEHFAPGEPDFLRAAARVHHGCGIDVTYAIRRGYARGEDRTLESGARIAGQTLWGRRRFRDMAELAASQPGPAQVSLAEEAGFVAEVRREQAALEPGTVIMRQGGAMLGYYDTGLELYSLALYDHPDVIERMIEANYQRAMRWTEIVCRHRIGPVFQWCEDLGHKHGLIFAPAFYRRVFFPRLKAAAALVHQAGMKFLLHSDGDITSLLDDVVAADVDGINPLESMDLAWCKRRYGDRLFFVGNVPADVMARGTPDQVRAATERTILAGGHGGGLILDTSAGELMPDVPVANVLAYFETAGDVGRYRRRG
jgi:hypothetical protein